MTTPDEAADKEDADDLSEKHTKSFLGHLDDLRKTILFSVGALVCGMLIAFPLAPWLRDVIKKPLDMANLGEAAPKLRIIGVTGGIFIATKIIVMTGLIISLPVIVLFICNFVFPGLTKIERYTFIRASGFAVILFAAGVCLGYFMTIPVALRFMILVANDWIGVTAEWWDEVDYIGFVLKVLLAFGLVFQLPVILLALGSMGIVSSRQLKEKRRHVVVGLMVMAMMLTPADPGTMLLMGLPMIGLFEACIWIIWFREKRKKEEEDI